MGITKQVYEYIDGSKIHMESVKKSRYLRRTLILDWFRRMGWITAEQRLYMGVQEAMRHYREEKKLIYNP